MNYQKAIDELNQLADVEANTWAQDSISCAISALLAAIEMRKIIKEPEIAEKHNWQIETICHPFNGISAVRLAKTSFVMKNGKHTGVYWKYGRAVNNISNIYFKRAHEICLISRKPITETERIKLFESELEKILISEFGE